MLTYLHLPLIVTALLILLSMWRFWSCIARMGFMREVGRRAPMMLQRDLLAAVLAIMPIILAAADWLSLGLPDLPLAIPSFLAVALSISGLAGSIFVIEGSSARLAGHWAGARESAVRTVAALRIIDAAELTFALQYIQTNTEMHQANHTAPKTRAHNGSTGERP